MGSLYLYLFAFTFKYCCAAATSWEKIMRSWKVLEKSWNFLQVREWGTLGISHTCLNPAAA